MLRNSILPAVDNCLNRFMLEKGVMSNSVTTANPNNPTQLKMAASMNNISEHKSATAQPVLQKQKLKSGAL